MPSSIALKEVVEAIRAKDYAALVETAKKAPLTMCMLSLEPVKFISGLEVSIPQVEKRLREEREEYGVDTVTSSLFFDLVNTDPLAVVAAIDMTTTQTERQLTKYYLKEESEGETEQQPQAEAKQRGATTNVNRYFRE